MTNAEKFEEIFGTDLKRQYSTKTWWEQEFVPNKVIPTLAGEINEKLINEYISKVGCCDECFASIYCTVNGLRESRVPQDYCVKNIKGYFSDKASPTGAESEG